MLGWLTPPDINDRERRWYHSLRAMRRLLCFGIATIIGYIIWGFALPNISPQLLTLNTFLWLAVFFSFGSYDRAVLWSWNSFISKYTFRIAAAQFLYWAAFWFGLVAARSASLALAFLGLNMLVSPLMVRQLEAREERSPLSPLLAVGFLLVASIILIKLDLPWNELDFDKLSLFFQNWLPIVCFLIAVAAEGFSDRTTYALGKKLEQMTESDKTRHIGNIRNRPAEKSTDDVIMDCATYQAIPLCFLVSLLLFIFLLILFITRSGAFPLSPSGTSLWSGIWLILLGLIGTSAKVIFVLPLQKQSLDSRALPPLIAGRQAIYFVLVNLWVGLLVLTKCWSYGCASLEQVIHDELPKGNFSYWVGIIIVVFIWIAAWAWFSKIGFFTKKVTDKSA